MLILVSLGLLYGLYRDCDLLTKCPHYGYDGKIQVYTVFVM